MSLGKIFTWQGKGNWSNDAVKGSGGSLQVVVPTGSTIVKAFLYADASTTSQQNIQASINGVQAGSFTFIGSAASNSAYRADVTSLITDLIGNGSSETFNLNLGQVVGSSLEGFALVVVYANENEQLRTITLLDGAANAAGDSFDLSFGGSVDPTASGFEALLSLGIGFSYQPGGQVSIVDVNGQRLTSSAGGQDDGIAQNGGLITIGGVGDSKTNPSPTASATDTRVDDELYDLTPFMTSQTTNLNIFTQNPSGDDLIFFAGFNVTAVSEVVVVPSGNIAPTATNLSAGETYTEDTSLDLTDIVVSDSDSANVTVTLTLSNPSAGALSTGTSGSVTSTYDAGTGVWSASGAKADVNALLVGVTFNPAANFNGNFTVATSVSDGVAPAVTGTKAFTGVAVNDAPVTVNEADSYAENAGIVKDVVANDTDVDDANAELTVGTANVRGSAPLSNGLTLGADGRALTFNQNAYQHVVNGQTVTGFDYLAAGQTATVEIDYNVKDSDGANSSSVTNPPYGTFTVTIVGVNDAPTATNLSAPETYTEDTPLNLTNIVASDVDSANLTVTLTLSNPAVGALSTGTSGSVTSSYNAGTGVWTASGATADVNALLSGVTFNPAANFNGSFTVATSVSDGMAAAVTGSKAFTGVPVEDPATAVRDSFITSEGSALNGSVYANNGFGPDTDPDSTIDPVTAINNQAVLVGSTITLPTGSTVRLNADGTVTFTPAASLSSLAVAGSGASNTQVNESVIYTLAGGSSAVATFTVNGIDNADTLLGTPGDDSMNAGIMDDVLIGYTGADVLNGGTGSDTASYAPDEGGVFVNLTLGQGYGNAAQGDTYTSIENVIGTGYNDFIIGDTGVNRLDGGAGNDTLIGAIGGDALVGGSGTDTASYEDNSGTVFVNLTLNAGSNNAAQGDSYSGIENLIGGLFDDFFIGDEQANRLDGAMGADTLLGAGGADTFVLKHAAGASSGFTHPNSGANVDTILDFTTGVDKIELSKTAFDALDIGNLNPNAFVLGTAAQDADDRIIYDQETGRLYYDADGSGSGAAVLFAVLDNKAPLAATDFAIAP